MKCPDCKKRVEPDRNDDWRCLWCHATGVTLMKGSRRQLVVVQRHLTFSGQAERTDEKGKTVTQFFGAYVLNQYHPLASMLTKMRAKVAA